MVRSTPLLLLLAFVFVVAVAQELPEGNLSVPKPVTSVFGPVEPHPPLFDGAPTHSPVVSNFDCKAGHSNVFIGSPALYSACSHEECLDPLTGKPPGCQYIIGTFMDIAEDGMSQCYCKTYDFMAARLERWANEINSETAEKLEKRIERIESLLGWSQWSN
jgi:hypothetical protein